MTKLCKHCDKWLEASDFLPGRGKCRKCRAEYAANHYLRVTKPKRSIAIIKKRLKVLEADNE